MAAGNNGRSCVTQSPKPGFGYPGGRCCPHARVTEPALRYSIYMQILPATEESITEALRILKEGGVIAHATETCYGLACDLRNPDAVQKLFAIKKRSPDQPVSALFSSIDDAKKYLEWSKEADALAAKYLPGPLTIILPMKADAPHQLFPVPALAPALTLGLRLSSLPLAMNLVTRFGSPISTTSANIHGEPSPYSATEIFERFTKEADQPDLILDSGELPQVKPSTVINLTDGTTLRSGDIALS